MNNVYLLGPHFEFDLNLDLQQILAVVVKWERILLQSGINYDKGNKRFDNGSLSTAYHNHFNLLTYTDPIIIKLYNRLREETQKILSRSECYMIKSWINIYKPGDYISYHGHMTPDYDAVYGHIGIKNTNRTLTTYKNMETNETADWVNMDGKGQFSRPDLTRHRSWPQDSERVTIGFDVINVKHIKERTNYWVPL